MTQFPFDVVGFDMDGTLLDTSGDLAAAVNHALASIGRNPLPVAAIRPMVGGGARHMLAQGLAASGGGDDATLDTLHQRLLTFYEAHMCVHTAPFPHALDALDELAARGATLGIMTNKREAYAVRLLADLGLSDRFACVIGGDTLGPESGKPAPAGIAAMVARCGGGHAAYVGDSIYDVEGGHAAGLPVVACSFGFRDRPVEALGADAVIDGFDVLVATLERMTQREGGHA